MKLIGRAILKLLGWKWVGEVPTIDKCVVVVAPHTSNWDFVIWFSARLAFGLKPSFMIKDSVFKWYSGWLFRALGGFGVDRSQRNSLVEQVVAEFKRRPQMWLGVAPEGTRKFTDHWKTGFYYIALGAEVPVLCVFLDTSKKEVGFGPLVDLSGDLQVDFAKLREFYSQKQGFIPKFESLVQPRPDR